MYRNPFTLEDKVIIITGASSGIGRQCAIVSSQLGAKVALIGRNSERLLETLNLMENNEKHYIYSIDLTEYEKINQIIEDIVIRFGKIKGVVNCAGISTTIAFDMIKPEKLNFLFQTNVQSAFNLTRIATKRSYFHEEGGSVIFISSVMGVVGEVGKSIYSVTKGALIALSKSLALELASRKIRVNCISPGVVDTPLSRNAIYSSFEESVEKIKAQHPLGIGLPEDVAYTCVFLLSDASRWITGTNVIVDGGYLAK
ncbi:MAG: SDR family oxidoreductase [Bacteroidales bacterium]|nr:SDR family oxidoreductase [Bacteroidales bacterium]